MRWHLFLGVLIFCRVGGGLGAEPPPLLVKAVAAWGQGRQELAFTQRTRVFKDDSGQDAKYERVERYDPSLPDNRRWKLLEVNGQPPTEEERQDIEAKRNRKPRKRAGNPPASYLDLDSARLASETERNAHFEVGIKAEAARFVPVDKIVVKISVDKSSETIDHISAALREPMRIAFGLAKIMDVDLDLQFGEPVDGPPPASEVAPGSTARVRMSKFGDPIEFIWSDFKEVPVYHGG